MVVYGAVPHLEVRRWCFSGPAVPECLDSNWNIVSGEPTTVEMMPITASEPLWDTRLVEGENTLQLGELVRALPPTPPDAYTFVTVVVPDELGMQMVVCFNADAEATK
ncbi:MAG: uncharacterized protein KVP18_003509 [Porospora cf. gigantea A]|nr:MAG: hypothetical protein KVP18_003509 [Porospora cf. gigantea A]